MGLKPKGSSSLQTGNTYYTSVTLTTSYQQVNFGFPATKISIANDSDGSVVQISWDSATVHHQLAAAEYKDIQAGGRTNVRVKGTTGQTVRITAE